MKAKLIRSSRTVISINTRFRLEKDRMIETNDSRPYWLWRQDLKASLENKSSTVNYFIPEVSTMMGSHIQRQASIVYGTSQRKLFIQIGCMRFVGKNRQTLLHWAKSAK